MRCSFAFSRHRRGSDASEEMQTVLDTYMVGYNTKRPHQGRCMNGRTPVRRRNSKKETRSN
jgi:hypothetical protein